MKKFSLILGTIFVFIFLLGGVETIREELRDRKLKKELTTKVRICEEPFVAFLKRGTQKDDICFFSEKVASTIDRILFRGSKNFIQRPVSKAICRVMSVTALPACLLCDTAYYTARGSFEGALILFSANSGNQKQAKKHFSKVKRCLLGFVAFPTGMISADMVSQHFAVNRSSETLVESYGKLYSTKCLELYPSSGEDVAIILKEARKLNRKIAFAGALMSQGKQAFPLKEQDFLIHFDYLNHVEIDPKNRIAKVGAGALWSDVQEAANQHKLAVKVMQASNIFSIGGSLSINCHGWDHKSGTLKETVHSLLVANAEGEIKRLFPGDELFDLVIGGLGGFAAILEAELLLTPNTCMSYDAVEMSVKDYLSYFRKQVINNEKIGMHYFRLCFDPKKMFETGIALNFFEDSSQGIISDIPFEPERGNTADRVKLGVIRRLPQFLSNAWQMERSGSLKEKKIDRNEAMTFHLRCIFNESSIDAEWLQEYFVPAHQLNAFISFLGKELKKNNVPVYNASIRYVKQNKSVGFSYARNEDMFAIVLFFNQSLLPKEIQKTRLWVQSVIDYLKEHEGTYYLPYQNFATLEQFQTCYPEWKTIAEKKKQYDPQLVFANGFYEEYVLPKNIQTVDINHSRFRSIFSNPTERKWVKDFLNHTFMELDQKKLFKLIDDILTDTNATDEKVYSALQKRIGESSFSLVKKISQRLKSISALKKDLSDQMQEMMGEQPFNGYVEIGLPGTLCRPLQKKLDLKGPLYVVNECEQLSDYLQSGFPRPYNRFVYLNEYEPIRHQDIPTGSVDLVVMYIGFHHIPENKLVPFIQSINRILSSGGSFVLMDHDATSSKHKEVLSVIYTIMNLEARLSLNKELREFRNFRSLAHWESLLRENGFVRDSNPLLIRQGDVTLNSLIRFTKKTITEEEFCTQIHANSESVSIKLEDLN